MRWSDFHDFDRFLSKDRNAFSLDLKYTFHSLSNKSKNTSFHEELTELAKDV